MYVFSTKIQFDTPPPFSRWSFCTVTLRNKKTKTKKMAMVGLYRWPLPFPPTIDFASSKGRFRLLADTTWYGRYGPILAELGRFDANPREKKKSDVAPTREQLRQTRVRHLPSRVRAFQIVTDLTEDNVMGYASSANLAFLSPFVIF